MSSRDWALGKLGDICEFKNGKKRPLTIGDYPIYGGNGILSYTNEYNAQNSIAIGRVGAYCGSVYLERSKFWISDNAILAKNNKKSDISFLYYLLSILQLNKRHIGTSQPLLTQEILNSISISYPELNEQNAIAATLSCLDDMIELNNRTNQVMEEMAQGIFKRWFVDFEFPNEDGEPYKSSGGEMVDSELGEIPKGWRVGTLDECIDFINGYAFASKDLLDEYAHNCYHVFKMGHIKKGGGFNSDGTKSYVPKDGFDLNSKYILRKGDLLMCMTDMKANVALLGHTALMNEDNKYVVNQRVGLLRINNDIGISYPYLYILTNSKDFIENLRGRANSGVQVNLSTNEIKASKMLIAPRYINEEFNNTVKALFDELFLITSENNKLTQIRDTLLPKLISGQIRVPVEEVV